MKKLISLTLATIFAMMCLFVSVSAEGNVLGDANGDGKVTTTDARMVLRCSTRLDPMDTILKELCDLNNDGKITTADARLILRVATRLDNAECLVNDHDFVLETTNPTCTESGAQRYVCSRCKTIGPSKSTSPLGHNFVSGKCTRCGTEDRPNAKLNLKWPLSEETKKIARDVFRFSDADIEHYLAEGTDITGTKQIVYVSTGSIFSESLDATINYGVSLETSELGRLYNADGTIRQRCSMCGQLPTRLWKKNAEGFWKADGCHGHIKGWN